MLAIHLADQIELVAVAPSLAEPPFVSLVESSYLYSLQVAAVDALVY